MSDHCQVFRCNVSRIYHAQNIPVM